MGVKNEQMTFYNSHSTIDIDHALSVREIIKHVAKTNDDWQGMKNVAKITFDLTLGIVKDSVDAYKALTKNESNNFNIFS